MKNNAFGSLRSAPFRYQILTKQTGVDQHAAIGMATEADGRDTQQISANKIKGQQLMGDATKGSEK